MSGLPPIYQHGAVCRIASKTRGRSLKAQVGSRDVQYVRHHPGAHLTGHSYDTDMFATRMRIARPYHGLAVKTTLAPVRLTHVSVICSVQSWDSSRLSIPLNAWHNRTVTYVASLSAYCCPMQIRGPPTKQDHVSTTFLKTNGKISEHGCALISYYF
jgi:hypothetical protein